MRKSGHVEKIQEERCSLACPCLPLGAKGALGVSAVGVNPLQWELKSGAACV